MDFIKYEHNKEEFLINYDNKLTIKYYKRVFDIAKTFEEKYDKDLYSFELEQLKELLKAFKATPGATEVYGRVISSYINWAIENNKINIENPLSNIKSNWFEECSDTYSNYYITDTELEILENRCRNPQDAVIIRLLFEGIGGDKVEEIRTLKKDDVNIKNNTVRIYDEDIKVSDKAISLLTNASTQEIYMKKNGTASHEKGNRSLHTQLSESEYIIRSSKTKTNNTDTPVHSNLIYNRIKNLAAILECPKLKATNILRSGQLLMAKNIMEEKNEYKLTTDDYKKIAYRYNINSVYTMKKYCNEDIARELYGDFLNDIN